MINFKNGDYVYYEHLEDNCKEYGIIISSDLILSNIRVKTLKALTKESEKFVNGMTEINKNDLSLITDQNIINMLNKLVVFE